MDHVSPDPDLEAIPVEGLDDGPMIVPVPEEAVGLSDAEFEQLSGGPDGDLVRSEGSVGFDFA